MNPEPKPRIIAIEGGDLVGKATQSLMLAKRLGALQLEVPWEDGPFGTHWKIYAMLNSGAAKTYPAAFQGVHAANRLVCQKAIIKQLAARQEFRQSVPRAYQHMFRSGDEWLVFDRWEASTVVYGTAAGLSKGCLDALMEGVWKPDLTIVLDGTPKAPPTDSYEADAPFVVRVRALYRAWAREHSDRAVVVDADRSRKVVAASIWEAVCKAFPDQL